MLTGTQTVTMLHTSSKCILTSRQVYSLFALGNVLSSIVHIIYDLMDYCLYNHMYWLHMYVCTLHSALLLVELWQFYFNILRSW